MDLRHTNTTFLLGLNNPCGLRCTDSTWIGKTGCVKGFVEFDTIENGLRAWMYNLHSQYAGGYTTLYKMISRLSPPSENDTKKYIENISKQMGISPFQRIILYKGLYIKMAHKVAFQENGQEAGQITMQSYYSAVSKLPEDFIVPNSSIAITPVFLLSLYKLTQ